MEGNANIYDVIVIGGGQSGLACAYYLQKRKIDYLVIDNQEAPGGAWNHTWESLHLFSPSESSSLPGWQMPKSTGKFPHKNHVLDYLAKYEERYSLNVQRPFHVNNISKDDSNFYVHTKGKSLKSKAIILATGTWSNRVVPHYPGYENFIGEKIHSGDYSEPQKYEDKKVLVVGGGNSGAQIAAELLKHTEVVWSCKYPPRFLPPDIDGKVLFEQATHLYRKKVAGLPVERPEIGDIVQVPDVKEALEKNLYKIRSEINRFEKEKVVFKDGDTEYIDSIIWCTGFRPALELIDDMGGLNERGRLKTDGTKALFCEGIWAVGYGNWTGFASATLIGVGRTAKKTVLELAEFLEST